MSTRESRSLRFNKRNWVLSHLGEKVLLVQCPGIPINEIHQSTEILENKLQHLLSDIVPSYDSIALFYNSDTAVLLEQLSTIEEVDTTSKVEQKHLEIPICYELGLDQERIAGYNNIPVKTLIQLHEFQNYSAVLIGFTPGFIYLDGLNQKIACPRIENPRQKIPAGSVGIGGCQTGIYSLNSPGGWNIIGRTPYPLFDKSKVPPMNITPGTQISFFSITKAEFEAWES